MWTFLDKQTEHKFKQVLEGEFCLDGKQTAGVGRNNLLGGKQSTSSNRCWTGNFALVANRAQVQTGVSRSILSWWQADRAQLKQKLEREFCLDGRQSTSSNSCWKKFILVENRQARTDAGTLCPPPPPTPRPPRRASSPPTVFLFFFPSASRHFPICSCPLNCFKKTNSQSNGTSNVSLDTDTVSTFITQKLFSHYCTQGHKSKCK